MTPTNNIKGALLALAGFGIYSIHDVLLRYLGSAYSPLQVLFFTSLFSFPLLNLMLVSDSTSGNLRPVHPAWVALRSVAMVLGGLCGFYAFANLPMTQVYSILFTVPLLITLMSIPILGESVGIHRAAAILLGLVGVVVVVQPGSAELTLGHIAAVGAAIFSALQAVIARKIGRAERGIVMLLYPFAATFVATGAGLFFVYEPVPFVDLLAQAAIAVLGFIAAFLLVGAYRAGEAAIVAPMQYSQIIWAAIYGALIFNDSLERATIVGAGIIIASGLYIVIREAFADVSDNTPVLRSRSRPLSPGSFRISYVLRRSRRKAERSKTE